MKKEINDIQPNNFFNTLKKFFYNLFHKSSKESYLREEISAEEKIDVDFFAEYRAMDEREKYLLDLQRKYESKEILEEDMIEEDRVDLEKLYIEQNNELKKQIMYCDKKLNKK